MKISPITMNYQNSNLKAAQKNSTSFNGKLIIKHPEHETWPVWRKSDTVCEKPEEPDKYGVEQKSHETVVDTDCIKELAHYCYYVPLKKDENSIELCNYDGKRGEQLFIEPAKLCEAIRSASASPDVVAVVECDSKDPHNILHDVLGGDGWLGYTHNDASPVFEELKDSPEKIKEMLSAKEWATERTPLKKLVFTKNDNIYDTRYIYPVLDKIIELGKDDPEFLEKQIEEAEFPKYYRVGMGHHGRQMGDEMFKYLLGRIIDGSVPRTDKIDKILKDVKRQDAPDYGSFRKHMIDEIFTPDYKERGELRTICAGYRYCGRYVSEKPGIDDRSRIYEDYFVEEFLHMDKNQEKEFVNNFSKNVEDFNAAEALLIIDNMNSAENQISAINALDKTKIDDITENSILQKHLGRILGNAISGTNVWSKDFNFAKYANVISSFNSYIPVDKSDIALEKFQSAFKG